MPNYRRRYCPGGTFFFSVMLAQQSGLNLLEHLHLLRISYSETLAENPFHTNAIVILPDHLHAVWTLPEGDADYSLRWRKIKGRFTRMIKHSGRLSDSALRRGERGIWQRRFWERHLTSETELRKHLAYCWSDPVRHGLVERAVDWTSSSLHREIRAGKIEPDWRPPRIEGTFGEREEDLELSAQRSA
ncbi:MAG: transposase [Pseudomonadota bacterium]